MKFSDYVQYDALGLAELVRRGEVSAQELLEAALARAEAVNPRINAVVHHYAERARGAISRGLPQGAFTGVPFLVKDLTASVAGEPRSDGSRFTREFRPREDHEIIRRFHAAGLVDFAKTNCPEWGLAPVTEPALFGPAHNPWNPQYTPGGSSGGSAAAVAAGIAPLAHGNDGGGSIRIPASCCGLIGLKPSRGRTPSGPVRRDGWWGASIEHVITRSVRDCAAALDAVTGPDIGAPYSAPPAPESYLKALARAPRPLRIALCTEPLLSSRIDSECLEATRQAAKLLSELGHQIEPFSPVVPRETILHGFMVLVAASTSAETILAAETMGRKPRRGEFEPETRALARLGAALSGRSVALAWERLGQFSRSFSQALAPYDLLLTPTLSIPPPRIGALKTRGLKRFALALLNNLPLAKPFERAGVLDLFAADFFEFIGYTPLANITGQPSISLPLGKSRDDLPLGVLATGRYGEEHLLLALAAQVETASPWLRKIPAGA